MFLKYNCPRCGYEIITKYLKPGDNLTCRSCNSEITVPMDAIETGDAPNLFKQPLHREPLESLENLSQLEGISIPEELLAPAEPPPEPTPWGIWSIVKFIGAYLGALILTSCPAGGIAGFLTALSGISLKDNKELFKSTSSALSIDIISLISFPIAILLIYYSVMKRHHHSNFYASMHFTKIAKTEALRYILIALGTCLFIIISLTLIPMLGLGHLIPKDLPINKKFNSGFGALIWFTLFAISAPIAEELVFRGYFFDGFKNKLGIKWAAIIVTILFILMHGPQLSFNPIMLIFISLLAILLIRIRIKTDSLTKCIIVHEIYNIGIVGYLWAGTIIFGPLWLKS